MRIRWVIGAAVLVGAVGLVAPAVAASSGAFTNGTFQCTLCESTYLGQYSSSQSGYYDLGTPPSTSTAVGATDIPGWTVAAGTVDWISTYWLAPPGGGNSLDMNGVSPGTIQQQFSTVSGATYFVSFELAGNQNGGPHTKELNVSTLGGTPTTFYFPNSASPPPTSSSGYSNTDMGWTAEGYTFVAASTLTTLIFAGNPSNGTAYGPALGAVAVTQVAASGAQCKDGGWTNGVVVNGAIMTFTNQGQCVSYFATSGDTPIGSPS